jgi:hypothetical protein
MGMKKNFYIVVLLAMMTSITHAQKIEGIAGFIQTGYMNAPNAAKAFNQVFPQNNSGFANNYFLIGAEAFYRQKNNVFMGEWQFGLQKVYSFNNQHAGALYEAVMGKYGRLVAEKENVWIYPSAGMGVSVAALTSYDEIDGQKKNMKTKTLVSPTFDMGMNADFLLSKLRWKENYYLGWISGIKAGYRFSIRSKKWKTDKDEFYKDGFQKLYETPSYANNAFYVMLSFGMGSFDKK